MATIEANPGAREGMPMSGEWKLTVCPSDEAFGPHIQFQNQYRVIYLTLSEEEVDAISKLFKEGKSCK